MWIDPEVVFVVKVILVILGFCLGGFMYWIGLALPKPTDPRPDMTTLMEMFQVGFGIGGAAIVGALLNTVFPTIISWPIALLIVVVGAAILIIKLKVLWYKVGHPNRS